MCQALCNKFRNVVTQCRKLLEDTVGMQMVIAPVSTSAETLKGLSFGCLGFDSSMVAVMMPINVSFCPASSTDQHNNMRIGCRVRSKGFNTKPSISKVTAPNNASSPSSPRITGV
jgi:hypothetical protein